MLLDDDEAVAVAVALRAASEGTASGLETAALSALTKLDQVLPSRLRERVTALRTVTIGLRGAELPPVDLDVLVVAAVACRRPERLRFLFGLTSAATIHGWSPRNCSTCSRAPSARGSSSSLRIRPG